MPRSTDVPPAKRVGSRRRRDAALAAAPFVVVLGTVLVGLVRPEPAAILVGAALAVLAEAVAARRAAAVRAVWERPAVRVGATALAVLAVAAGAFWPGGAADPHLVSLAAGGLGAYLLLLAAAALGPDG